MLNKLSSKDIASYKESFNHWMAYWGLNNQWTVDFHKADIEEIEEGKRFYGAVVCDCRNRMTIAFVPSHWEDRKITRRGLDKTAFHEALHVLLSHLDEGMEKVGVQHMIIRMLEVLVYSRICRKFPKG